MPYTLPLLSAVALVLVFYPANLWWLAVFALAPLYYFAAAYPAHPLRVTLWGAFATGALYASYLSVLTVVQFHWLPPAYLFAWGVRLSFIPIALISGTLMGCAFLLYRLLRTRHAPLNALVGGALFTLSELILKYIFGSFYFGAIGSAATGVPFLLPLAALGGEPLLSFVFATAAAFVAEAFISRRSIPWAAGFVMLAVAAAAWAHPVLSGHEPFSVAVIQLGDRKEAGFARVGEEISFPQLEARLAEAQQLEPDLIIYPFSPVEGAVFRGGETPPRSALGVREEALGAWLARAAPRSTVMTWNPVRDDGAYYNAYQYWRGGEMVGEYRKRALFPFLDYTPQWAKRLGLYTTVFDVSQSAGGTVKIGEVTLGALLCSEVNHPELAREDAARALLLVAAGSEAMFESGIASDFNLRAAQLRAAENAVSVVRANLLGPSALIASDGSIINILPQGASGVLHGTLNLGKSTTTPFGRFGSAPLWGMLVALPLVAALLRRYGIHE